MTPATRRLRELGIVFGEHAYERSDDLRDFGREAADALGLDLDEVFKTLLIDVSGGVAVSGPRHDSETVVVVVPVSCSVSMKAVAAVVGAKRAAMCDPVRAERLTGYVVGGISPIGQRTALPTIVDETIDLFDVVYVSGGRRGFDVSLAPADLVAATDATVADVAVSSVGPM
ncbi:MAG: Cys-tRNA(Pro) deacylase [Actinomycetota bacterium]